MCSEESQESELKELSDSVKKGKGRSKQSEMRNERESQGSEVRELSDNVKEDKGRSKQSVLRNEGRVKYSDRQIELMSAKNDSVNWSMPINDSNKAQCERRNPQRRVRKTSRYDC